MVGAVFFAALIADRLLPKPPPRLDSESAIEEAPAVSPALHATRLQGKNSQRRRYQSLSGQAIPSARMRPQLVTQSIRSKAIVACLSAPGVLAQNLAATAGKLSGHWASN